jgi:hypothetical protein
MPKWPQMTPNDHSWEPFLNPISPNTDETGGTFEITVQKDPPNDPRWPFLRTLFRPHITKHQRNRGNFWNNGPKVTLLDPKPCRFYWYLTQNDPKSALNDPKSDSKLSTCIFGAAQNNEISAPHLDWVGKIKVVQYVNAYQHEKCTSKCTILDPKWGHLGPLLGSYSAKNQLKVPIKPSRYAQKSG